MNPYDFVRIEKSSGPRRAPFPHNRCHGFSGRFTGTIQTLTPLFIQGGTDQGSTAPQPFLQSQGKHIIPGTSLKGLIRNLVETIDGGFFWFCQEEKCLPHRYRRTSNLKKLDAASRMFGFLNGESVLAGHVGFEDAICSEPVLYDPIYTPILSTPKPRHESWYLDGEHVRGRKFYFHANEIKAERRFQYSPKRIKLNQRIRPIGAKSKFIFCGHFSDVSPDDFRLLLYALTLEPAMRHKIGYAKPAGLGSIEIRLTQIELVDRIKRYRSGKGGITCLAGNELRQYITEQTKCYIDNRSSLTLQDLRRIWHWPPQHQDLRYPLQQWFKDNPKAPIEST